MERLRTRLVLASTTIVLVIVFGAVTGIVALRSTVADQQAARALDAQILALEHLRDDTLEIAASARRYMVSGDDKERQRVLAMIDEVDKQVPLLKAASMRPSRPLLEADLDSYQLGVLDAISSFDPEPVERLTRFEEQLTRVRLPLSAVFDDAIANQRARRAELRSASSLGHSAQATLLLASVLGAMLAIGICITVLRETRTIGFERAAPPSPDEPAFRLAPFDVSEVIEQCVASRRSVAARRGLRLKVEPLPSATVLADRDKIREVLEQLLDVAIDDGRLSSELVLRVGDVVGGVRVALIDAGPRREASHADPIALLLLRQVVEAQGGKLGVQSSSINRTYWFTLPSGEPALLG